MWVSPHSGCQRFRSDSLDRHEFSKYHQDVNPSHLLVIQKGSKVAFNKTFFSTAEDLDLVNKFSIVFTKVKERVSFNNFPNMCRGEIRVYPCFLFKLYKRTPRKMGSQVRALQVILMYVNMSNAYTSRTFAREATFSICATLWDWESKKFSCSRFFGHVIDEVKTMG